MAAERRGGIQEWSPELGELSSQGAEGPRKDLVGCSVAKSCCHQFSLWMGNEEGEHRDINRASSRASRMHIVEGDSLLLACPRTLLSLRTDVPI